MSAVTNCRYFTGYKPCGKSEVCSSSCAHKDIPQLNIVLIHLGAMGAVVRSTALLAPIKRKYPSSRITWITESPMHKLLQDHPLIDRVLTTSAQDLCIARTMDYEIGFIVDKSQLACGIAQELKIDMSFGFTVDAQSGAILPATWHAQELWEIGLSDQKKFFENQKTENQLVAEALGLSWKRDDYDVRLNYQEIKKAERSRHEWRLDAKQPIIGFNTGCGPLMPAKKWTPEFHRQVLKACLAIGYQNLVLLGGPDDQITNQAIAKDLPVIQSSTDQGIRTGAQNILACDIVVTGDSLGMHLAIAMKKHVIAWFGPSCEVEIDLFDRGEKLLAEVGCSPCWKKDCQKSPMCYDRVALEQVMASIGRGVQSCLNHSYLSRLPSWETFS